MQETYDRQFKYVVGTVSATIYSNYNNPLSPYTICEVDIQDTNVDIVSDKIRIILHTTPPEKKNNTYKFFGTVETSEKYGLSFKCETYIRNIPIDSTGAVDFLGSGLFHGIKRKRAEQIVETLGDDCLIQIVNSPEVLHQVKGIPIKTIESIQETIIENLGMQKIILKLHEWNISLNLAKKIHKLYGDASVQKITENPYCLANTIRGISFKRADHIADIVEIRGMDGRRIKGAIEHALHEIYDHEGSTFANKGYVMQKVDQILYDQDGVHYPSEVIDENLTELVSTDINELDGFTTEIGQVRQIGYRIFLAKYYGYEIEIAQKLTLLHSTKKKLTAENTNDLINHHLKLNHWMPFELSSEQDIAIIESIRNNVLVITGGPGTGKSTIIKSILILYRHFFDINNYDQFMKKVILLAPTGRAAKRMTDITGIPARTIHNFLITYQSENEAEGDRLFIIDEMSMMDIGLMSRLLEKLHKGNRIILVGDKEQLPPVNAGNVFADIIDSKAFPTVELKSVFRQQQQSMIHDLAASIREGNISEILIESKDDVKWLPTPREDILKTIESELFSILERNIPFEDIQIIVPIHRGELGITNINKHIQYLLIEKKIPSPESFAPTGFLNSYYEFFTGDRVVQLKNNNEKNVLNGDFGTIIGQHEAFEHIIINEETLSEELVEEPKRLIVRFEEEVVYYYEEEMEELALAYCFSVHKAQGSEFPIVLLPISSAYRLMLNRNLLYTAITRAKKEVTIIGELDVFLRGLEEKPHKRFTFLKEMLEDFNEHST